MWADRDGSRSGEQALVDISPGVYVCSTQGTDHPVVLHPVRGSPSRPPPPLCHLLLPGWLPLPSGF